MPHLAEAGQFALALAFVVTLYSIAASLIGIRTQNDKLIASGRNAALGTCVAISTAIFVLAYLIMTDDFSVAYVAGHSSADLPLHFKLSSVWGGQEGSMLFWAWILTVYSGLVIIQNRNRHRSMMPYVTSVLMGTSLFFTAMHLFVANPFKLGGVQMPGGAVRLFHPADGDGLNPLLQDTLMVIHPPMLYIGMVGFAIPYAFGIAALITRQLGDTWIRTTRRWTMITWGFLGVGVLLGGFWAYHELGWGGFWAWDPVENASLMPWLIGTAYLHSVMVQEKKGMMKVWNMVLVVAAYTMSIFGTTLTRSGLVESVHAFAKSDIGGYFMAFIVVTVSGAAYLIIDRLPYLKPDSQMGSVVSRESSFMFNNLILLVSCFAVLWGTMFPVLSEWITDEKITVGAPFFNRVNIPIAIFLLFLTGVGPLLAWRKASTNSLKRNFLMPAGIALASGIPLYLMGVNHFYAWLALVMSIFVGITIIREFYKGAQARAHGTGERFHEAIVNLTLRNTRRYGGYIIHFGFVLLFVGWSGQAFSEKIRWTPDQSKLGSVNKLYQYDLRIEEMGQRQGANFAALTAKVSLYEHGTKIAELLPEWRKYGGRDQQGTTEVAILSMLKADMYLVFQGSSDGVSGDFTLWYNPLVMWVWIGGGILAIGTLIALLPNKQATSRKSQLTTPAGAKEGEEIEQGVS
jgi:cytochrome c-type biogenesis protein CcmF